MTYNNKCIVYSRLLFDWYEQIRVCVIMSSVRPAGDVQKLIARIFVNDVTVFNVKLCKTIVPIEQYPFMLLSMNLTLFQGHIA